MSDPYANFPLARANDFPDKRETHPRTAMIDLLEEVRLAVSRSRGNLRAEQILVVLSEVMADHKDVAFNAVSQRT